MENKNIKRAPVLVGRLRLAETAWRNWALTVEPGTTPADLLDMGFWAKLAPKLAPRDRVHVIDDDNTWAGEYFVRAVGVDRALVTELWAARLDGAEPAEAGQSPNAPFAEMEARWCGHRRKWAVIYRSTNSVICEGIESREEAEQFIRDNPDAKAA